MITTTSAPITVTLVEDTPDFLQHLSAVITATDDFRLAGVATNGRDARKLIDGSGSDLYIIDLGLPDISGIEVIRHAYRVHPGAEIIVISLFDDDDHVLGSIEAGASGYLLKDSTDQEILDGMRNVCEGGAPISPGIARKILRRFCTDAKPPRPAAAKPPGAEENTALTPREVEILHLLAKGLAFIEIGESLSISSHTVAKHVKNTYRKLAVNSRGEAVFEASRLGLLTNLSL